MYFSIDFKVSNSLIIYKRKFLQIGLLDSVVQRYDVRLGHERYMVRARPKPEIDLELGNP